VKITTILGSPKKHGNTAAALAIFEELVSGEHQVERFNMADVEVRGCKGCDTCKKNPDEPACIQQDDAETILRSIMEADAVVYASPLYCWSFPAELKALLDRHYCLVTGYGTPDFASLAAGTRTALLVTCAGPVENNADLIQKTFDRMGNYLQFDLIGNYILPFCTTPDALGEEAKETVKQMAADIADQ
jgi:NAD(P)H-dependent FMN reductase